MTTTLLRSRACLSMAILFISITASISMGYAQDAHELSDSEYALCKAKIERAHAFFYKLPFSQDYVKDVIMPVIRNERISVAPHFPVRQAGVNADEQFRNWIENYPTEYELYLVFLRKQHEKWRIASTSSANH